MPDLVREVLGGPTKPGPYDITKAQPLYRSDGNINHLCGTCRFPLAKNMNPGQIKNLSIICPICGSQNGFPP